MHGLVGCRPTKGRFVHTDRTPSPDVCAQDPAEVQRVALAADRMVLLGVVFIEIELNTIAGRIAEEQLHLSSLGGDRDLVADAHLG